jgi:hypothetical protein
MRLRFSLPSDRQRVLAALSLVDSLLIAGPASPSDAMALASLAAVTGRIAEADRLAKLVTPLPIAGAPVMLAATVRSLLIYSAGGGPTDTLRVLEQRVDSVIRTGVSPADHLRVLNAAIPRAATLAYPVYTFSAVSSLRPTGWYLFDAIAAFHRGDTVSSKNALSNVRAARWNTAPADLTIDALFPEAYLLVAIGDVAVAIEWLDPTLRSIRIASPLTFLDPIRAASLVRAMALRAELASRVNDVAAARLWSDAVSMLWSDADPFLQPVVQRMRRLSQ